MWKSGRFVPGFGWIGNAPADDDCRRENEQAHDGNGASGGPSGIARAEYDRGVRDALSRGRAEGRAAAMTEITERVEAERSRSVEGWRRAVATANKRFGYTVDEASTSTHGASTAEVTGSERCGSDTPRASWARAIDAVNSVLDGAGVANGGPAEPQGYGGA